MSKFFKYFPDLHNIGKLKLCKMHKSGYEKNKKTPKARLRTFLFENGHERDFFVVIYKQRK